MLPNVKKIGTLMTQIELIGADKCVVCVCVVIGASSFEN